LYIPDEKNALIHSANTKEHRDKNRVTMAALYWRIRTQEYILLGVTSAIVNYVTWYVERIKESKKENELTNYS
jgi:hypothetical protein